MRFRALPIAAVVSLSILAGCSGVYTTTRLPSEREPGIVGRWLGGEAGDDVAVITATAQGYLLESTEQGGEKERTPFTISHVGDNLFLQSPTEGCPEFAAGQEPCYYLIFVRLEGDRMDLRWLSADRLAADSINGALTIPHELHRRVKTRGGGGASTEILLQGTREELEGMLESYAQDEAAFEQVGRLRRLD